MVSSPGRRASYVRCFVCADDAPVTMTTVRTASVKAVMSRIGPRACHLPTDTTVTYRVRGYGDYPMYRTKIGTAPPDVVLSP